MLLQNLDVVINNLTIYTDTDEGGTLGINNNLGTTTKVLKSYLSKRFLTELLVNDCGTVRAICALWSISTLLVPIAI